MTNQVIKNWIKIKILISINYPEHFIIHLLNQLKGRILMNILKISTWKII